MTVAHFIPDLWDMPGWWPVDSDCRLVRWSFNAPAILPSASNDNSRTVKATGRSVES